METKKFFSTKTLWILGTIALIAIIFELAPAMGEWFDRLLASAEAIVVTKPGLGLLVFIILSALSAILSFFSTAVLVPVAVAVWGEMATSILLLLSWLIGGTLAYWLAYKVGRPLAIKFIKAEKFDYYANFILARATFPLVVLFRLAIPSEVGGLLLGALRYPFSRYLLATAITELPFAIILAYAGGAIVGQKFWLLAIYAVVVIAFLVFFGLVLRRYIIKRNNVAISKEKDSRHS